jgi:hypothetical protein
LKISPIRNEQEIKVVDDTGIKSEIEQNKEFKKEDIEDEISKTMYIKDLKEKMRQFEENAEAEPSIADIVNKKEEAVETTKAKKKPARRVVKNTHSSRRASNYKKAK